MEFSIVITTCNRLSLLKRAVNSALSQTKDCEVVVIDNGSADGTQAYLQQLEANGSIILRRNPENLGHSTAINRGVELAHGDWIKPLDDDDYLAPIVLRHFLLRFKPIPKPLSPHVKQHRLRFSKLKFLELGELAATLFTRFHKKISTMECCWNNSPLALPAKSLFLNKLS